MQATLQSAARCQAASTSYSSNCSRHSHMMLSIPSGRSLAPVHNIRTALTSRERPLLVHAFAGAMRLDGLHQMRESVDPMSAAKDNGVYTRGQVLTIHSAAELEAQLAAHKQQLVVLMCKARSCRPCKMFARKYSRIAEKVPEVVFLDVMGDENDNTRRMMIQNKVKATPTFQLFRGGELVDTVTGTNDKKLTREVVTHMTPEEQAAHPEEMALLAAGTTSEEDAEELAAATH